MFKEFIKKLENHSHVGVFSHIRPDGDCIGAQVALCRWLQNNGYNAHAFNNDEVPQNLTWLQDVFPVHKPNDNLMAVCDLFILVDGNASKRFGSYENWQKKHSVPAMIVDHHPDPEPGFDVQIVEEKASSTCELIYRLFAEHNIDQLDSGTAKALYTGVITDTGSLQFDSVTPETVEIVADLLRRGKFTPNEVAEKVFATKTPAQLQLLSLALGTIQLFEDNQIAVMSVTQAMLQHTGTTSADCEGFVNYPLNIAGVKAAVLFKDQGQEGVKMSLRSRSDIDVNLWARKLDGGGHKKAAGAWHPGPLEKAIRDTVRIGTTQLKELTAG